MQNQNYLILNYINIFIDIQNLIIQELFASASFFSQQPLQSSLLH